MQKLLNRSKEIITELSKVTDYKNISTDLSETTLSEATPLTKTLGRLYGTFNIF